MITLLSTASQTPDLTLSFANPPSGTEQLPQAFDNILTEMLEQKPVEEELTADPAVIPTPPILAIDMTSTIGTAVAYTETPEATDAINQPGSNTTVDELLDNLSTGTPLVNTGKAMSVEPILTGEQYRSTDATEPTPPVVGNQPFSVLEHPSELDQAIPAVTDKLAAAVNLPNSRPFSTLLQTEGQSRPVQTHTKTPAGTFSNPVADTATNTASEISISVTPNMESGETRSTSENNPAQISSPAIFAESGKSLPQTPLVNAGKAASVEPILTGEQYRSTDATEPDRATPPVTDKLAAAVNLPNSQPFSTLLQTEGQSRPVQTHTKTPAGTFSNPLADTATNTASEISISVTPNMESSETRSASENNPAQISNPAIFAESGKSLPHPVAAITPTSHSATAGTFEVAANNTSTLATPFQQPDWSDTFSQKITWLATQQIQAAELKLNPAHLGPIEISLKLNSDQQLIAQFVSHHPAVREAIEANLPKLREIMAENGITLADTSVSADTPQQQAENGQNGSHPRRPATDNYFSYGSADPGTPSPLPATRHTGLIDTFA